MKYVYIAGPYTQGDVVINVRKAILAAEVLAERGFVPFVPHLTHLWHLAHPHGIEFWYAYDLQWLARCDCLVRLSGESKGADAEVAEARRLGMPVYFSLMECVAAQEDVKVKP